MPEKKEQADNRDIWDKVGDVVQLPIGGAVLGVVAGHNLGKLAGRKLIKRADNLRFVREWEPDAHWRRHNYTLPALKLEGDAARLKKAGRWAGAGVGSVVGNEVSKRKK